MALHVHVHTPVYMVTSLLCTRTYIYFSFRHFSDDEHSACSEVVLGCFYMLNRQRLLSYVIIGHVDVHVIRHKMVYYILVCIHSHVLIAVKICPFEDFGRTVELVVCGAYRFREMS